MPTKSTALSLVLLLASVIPPTLAAPDKSPIIRLDPSLDTIVPADGKVEELPDIPGPGTREGPVWIRKGGYLLYSDLGIKTINKWDPDSNQVKVFLKDTDSDGVTLDRQGRVVWVGGGEVVRVEKDGERTVLASEYHGSSLNAPNDLVYKSDGALYFTDPGRISWDKNHHIVLSKDVPTVYLLKDGNLRVLTTKVVRCNGIAFSPGEKYLYVNSSYDMLIMRFKVLPDDSIADGTVFFNENADGMHQYPSSGFPDGMKVDEKGNVYCTGPDGIWIISPNGKHLGTITGLNHPANMTFGEPNGKTLYVTSRPGVYRIRLKIPGIRP